MELAEDGDEAGVVGGGFLGREGASGAEGSRTLYIAVSERACPEPAEGPGCCGCTRLRCASSSSPKARMRAFAASSHEEKGKWSKQRVLL